MRRHASGQACVDLAGKTHYLGVWGSREAGDKYDRLIGEWVLRGRARQASGDRPLTVVEVIAAYVSHLAATRNDGKARIVRKQTREHKLEHLRTLLGLLRRLYGDIPADSFGPKSLTMVQQEMARTPIADPRRAHLTICRREVNKRVNMIKAMFRWAASVELVSGSTSHALDTVPALAAGTKGVREKPPVTVVESRDVDEVIQAALPQVATMIQLQLLTGMRPNEVCIMRGCDIEVRAGTWVYTPHFHKTERLGIARKIHLGPQAQELVKSYMTTDLQAYIFTPQRGLEEMYQRAHDRAKHSHPRQVAYRLRKREAEGWQPRRFNERYDCVSYGNSIRGIIRRINRERAAQGIAPMKVWAPNRLRHNAATLIRQQFGLEAASVILGHSDLQTTQIYAEADHQKAADVMQKVG